jgi:OPT oligopeptide transporter protein
LEVDPTLLAEQGLPFYAGTWIINLLTTNIGVAATFTHLLLWNRDDLRGAWSWANKDSLKRMWTEFDWRIWNADGKREVSPDDDLDPHYREMLKVLSARICSGGYRRTHTIAVCRRTEQLVWCHSGLCICHRNCYNLQNRFDPSMVSVSQKASLCHYRSPLFHRWGFIISCLLAVAMILCFGSIVAITGLVFFIQPFPQMIGGFLHPGRPMANMYFVLFSYSGSSMTALL